MNNLSTAEVIVAHGNRQAKKGKMPSIAWHKLGIRNPRKALALARKVVYSTVEQKEYFKYVVSCLCRFRTNPSITDSDSLETFLYSAGLTCKDIGIDEKEIDHLDNLANLNMAKSFLGFLRDEKSTSSFHIDYVKDYVEKAGVKLEDIGTSDEELVELEKKCNINMAKSFLGFLRDEKLRDVHHIDYVKDFAQKAGVPLEFIGTSDEELCAFANR